MYRVKFKFAGVAGYYFTEWFEDSTEAFAFVDIAEEASNILILAIECEV